MDKRHDLKLVRMKNVANILFSDIKTQIFPAEMIILFGSVAQDSINLHSDMDICIVSDEDLTIKQQRSIENYFYSIVQDEFELDFVYCNKEKLKTGTRVFENIRNGGRVLYG